MEMPEDIQLKFYKMLIALYADQMGVIIKCEIEHGDQWVPIDTSKISLDKVK